jgi:hypothetical protein
MSRRHADTSTDTTSEGGACQTDSLPEACAREARVDAAPTGAGHASSDAGGFGVEVARVRLDAERIRIQVSNWSAGGSVQVRRDGALIISGRAAACAREREQTAESRVATGTALRGPCARVCGAARSSGPDAHRDADSWGDGHEG